MQIPLKNIIQAARRYSKNIFTIFYYKFLSLFFNDKDKFRGAWLLCERGIEARDNGYTFFKFMRENYPCKKVFYLIDSSQKKDYEKLKSLGNIIEYNSFEHRMAVFFASHFLSTHIGFITPWSYKLYKMLFAKRKKQIFVLLNHGVTKEDMSLLLNKFMTGVDIFVAATNGDWEAVALDKRYGYNKKDVVLTGYARYDNWHNFTTKRQILFMPTWRKYLVSRNVYNKNNPHITDNFIQSSYFKHLSSFLNNIELHKMLENTNLDLIFYPHYEMQKSLPLFKINSDRIKIARKETHDIPTLLKESLMLISDYSGVTFDFAYMKKPLIYYQFDQEEYYAGHYTKGGFEMENDGLGTVVTNEENLLSEIKRCISSDFKMEEKYIKRVNRTFTFQDDKNCERIYNAINNYKL
jgi:hypothetical protein